MLQWKQVELSKYLKTKIIMCLAPLCYANAQQNLQENHPFYGHYTGQPALAGTSS